MPPRITHSGGAIVSYLLSDKTGAVLATNVQAGYYGPVKHQAFRKLNSQAVGPCVLSAVAGHHCD